MFFCTWVTMSFVVVLKEKLTFSGAEPNPGVCVSLLGVPFLWAKLGRDFLRRAVWVAKREVLKSVPNRFSFAAKGWAAIRRGLCHFRVWVSFSLEEKSISTALTRASGVGCGWRRSFLDCSHSSELGSKVLGASQKQYKEQKGRPTSEKGLGSAAPARSCVVLGERRSVSCRSVF